MHAGPLDRLPSTASPGLLFLQSFIPALDSLEPAGNPIRTFITADALFVVNGQAIGTLAQVTNMIEARSTKLSTFRHDVSKAWDIAEDDGPRPRRTVMYESTSVTVFRDDPEQLSVEVAEFNIVELEIRGSQAGSGPPQYKAVELRTFMDAKPVHDREMRVLG